MIIFQCKYWDEASLSWKNDSCEAEEELTTKGTTTYVVCKCFRTGAVAAFEVAKVVSGTGPGSGGTGGTNWGGSKFIFLSTCTLKVTHDMRSSLGVNCVLVGRPVTYVLLESIFKTYGHIEFSTFTISAILDLRRYRGALFPQL